MMKARGTQRGTLQAVHALALVVAAGINLWGALPAGAIVTVGVAHGYGSQADLTLGPAPALAIFSQPSIVDGAPGPFVGNANLPALNVSSEFNAFTMAEFITGDSDVNISSDVDGLLGVRSAAADSTVADVEVRVFSQIPPVVPTTFTTLFELNATEIASSADVGGDFGAFAAASTATLAGTGGPGNDQASITVTTEFDSETFLLATSPAPNSGFTIVPGVGPGEVEGLEGTIQVILNELTLSGNGITEREVDVKALRVIFNSGMLAFPPDLEQHVFFGEFSVARSLARLEAQTSTPTVVPEPSTIWLGLSGLALLRRRRR